MTNLSRPQTVLETARSEALRRWNRPGALAAVRSAVRMIEGAQARLAKRSDARANSARTYLAKEHARLSVPLKAIEEMGLHLDQPKALTLLERIAVARAS